MIEITHRQARRLLRQGLDERPLPDEQWAMLQAHLEACPECRAYAGRLAGAERDLARALADRWNVLHAPSGGSLAGAVAASRRAGLGRKQRMTKALAGAGLALLVIGFFAVMQFRQNARRAETPPPAAATQAAPTPRQEQQPVTGPLFRGLAAYAAVQDGNSDIFLLNRSGPPGSEAEITNLTQNPAEDIAPAWSPDGEWIAFLSDRESPGRFELYVMTVAGTRLTRLTAREDVTWSAPLAWAANGAYIALIGKRSQPGAGAPAGIPFLFFVPLAGEDEYGPGPRTLGFTRGVTGPLRFSPAAALLAYAGPQPAGLLVYDQISATFTAVTPVSAPEGAPLLAEGDFDWSPDGRQIAYLSYESAGEAGGGLPVQRLRLSGDLFSGVQAGGDAAGAPVLATAEPGGMRQVTWLPSRSRRVLAYLGRSDTQASAQEGGAPPGECWTLRLLQVDLNEAALPQSEQAGAAAAPANEPREVRGLCIDGPLGPASWSAEGEWLLAAAHLPGETQAGIYAVRIARDLALLQPAVFDRLADAAVVLAEALGAPVLVRPLPEHAVLNGPIDPQPAAEAPVLVEPAAGPAVLPGRLLANVAGGEAGEASALRVASPPGRAQALLSGMGSVECPTGEPGGERVAFLSNLGGQVSGGNELFVAHEDESGLRRLTNRMVELRPINMRWGCPAWSPDGTRLALTAQDGFQNLLLVLPADGSPGVRLKVGYEGQPTMLTAPVWSPDGGSIALAWQVRPNGPMRISLIDLTASPPTDTLIYMTDRFDTVIGMAFSPPGGAGNDAPRIAFIAAQYGAGGRAQLSLYSMHTDGENLELLSELPDMEFQGWVDVPNLAWLADGTIFFLVRHRVDARYKTSLWEYDLTERQRRPLAAVEDMVYGTAWSPDGRWLAYSSDGGLYLMDKQALRRGDAAPMLLSGERVFEIDWH